LDTGFIQFNYNQPHHRQILKTALFTQISHYLFTVATSLIIVSVLNQIGWKSKIQSIVTETDLLNWYEKALRGKFANSIGDKVLKKLTDEIQVEFPATDNAEFMKFIKQRGYEKLSDKNWQIA
jgi:type II restriction enzyme